MSQNIHAQKILILDFGSQYTQLIARRIREVGVYCEIYAWDITEEDIRAFDPWGIILSGGPESVTGGAGSPRAPGLVFELATQLATRLDRTNRKLGDLAFVDVTGRVAHAIMDLCNEPDAMTHPDGMQIKVSRQELSRLVGCSREMAGRALKSLEQEGLVAVFGKTMVVHGTR